MQRNSSPSTVVEPVNKTEISLAVTYKFKLAASFSSFFSIVSSIIVCDGGVVFVVTNSCKTSLKFSLKSNLLLLLLILLFLLLIVAAFD